VGAKMWAQKGVKINMYSIEIIFTSISIFFGMPNPNLPLFFISALLGGGGIKQKKGGKNRFIF